MIKAMHLLVTRPQPDAERMAASLRARGHDVTVAPLLRFEPVADVDWGAGPWSGVLLTSVNAVRAITGTALMARLAALPVFAVGGRTAEAARAAGFVHVRSADGDMDALADLVVRQREPTATALIYLAGEDRAGDLAGALAHHGISVRAVVVYRVVAATALPSGLGAQLAAGAIDGVLHFSRRSAETYLACAKGAGLVDRALTGWHYCLSANVAAPLLDAGATHVMVADRPDEAAVLDLVGVCGP